MNALIASYLDKRHCDTIAIRVSTLRQNSENDFEYHKAMFKLLNAYTAYAETQINILYRLAVVAYG